MVGKERRRFTLKKESKTSGNLGIIKLIMQNDQFI